MKKLVTLSVLILSLILFTSASVGAIDIGPGALPDWHENAQVQLGWIFSDPINPQNSTPLSGWDKAIDTIIPWDYEEDRVVWDSPGQWHILILNLEEEKPVKHFWISWVYAFDPYTPGPRVFTNIEWFPDGDYGNFSQKEEWFDSSGNPTTDLFNTAYARITISLDIYPNPYLEDIWLGTKGSMMVLEVYVKTLCLDPCEGDFDKDGDVDGSDLAIFAAEFGRTDCLAETPCEGDFDNDGDVDGSDLAIFAADFGRTDCLS